MYKAFVSDISIHRTINMRIKNIYLYDLFCTDAENT